MTKLIDLIFPSETNHHGTLFGGTALAHMDKVAFIAACRHAHADFVTASCDRIDFEAPALMSEIVEVSAKIVRTGRRSLTVETDLVAEALLSGERRLCSRGRFNMVTTTPDSQVPPLGQNEPEPDEGDLCMVDLVLPDQSNHRNILHGGYALSAMGKAAFVTATRFSRKTVVMAANQGMRFIAPVYVGEIIEITARVVETGRSSMLVSVSAWGENLQSGQRQLSAQGQFTMVALDDDLKPTVLIENTLPST